TTIAISLRTKTILVVTAALCLAAMTCACRRNSGQNANANGPTSTNGSDAEQSKRQAKSLVDKGKELADPDHNQDEQAVQAFQEAIRLQPDLAEAHLRLGMAYAALDKKTEAEESYKKAIEIDPDDYRASDAIENAKQGTQRIKEGRKHAEDMLKKQANANGNLNVNSNSGAKASPRRSPGKSW